MKQAEINAGQLTVTVDADGKFGWCGLSRIEHQQYPKQWLLSPAFTLEHFIGIPLDSSEYVEYEPCYGTKQLESVSADRCTLRYDESPSSKIVFAATYQVVAPHYVDVTMTMQTARQDWPLKYAALFFATIVNAPLNLGINLLGEDILAETQQVSDCIHFNSLAAQPGKTAHPYGVQSPELPRTPNSPTPYYFSDSSIRFKQPLFYAPIDNMVFALMFPPKERERIRFTVNPLAPAFGGPAWDFFWVIHQPKIEESYSLSFRTIFKPFVSADDILQEYETYLAGANRVTEKVTS